jgi:hypothetical protein
LDIESAALPERLGMLRAEGRNKRGMDSQPNAVDCGMNATQQAFLHTHPENVFPFAANVAPSNCTRGLGRLRLGACQNREGAKMDASLLIGAPLGLGLLLALGGLMVVMSYLSQ